MSDLTILGVGAVSPAGWGVEPLLGAVRLGRPLAPASLARPGSDRTFVVHRVPPPSPRPAVLANPRLRRSSLISQFAVAAAHEAVSGEPAACDPERVGLVFCTMTGSVIYSRRFYEEVLREPATASPMLFPETVFNAPASHVAAVMGWSGRVHTEVGDAGCFVKGLSTAALWLRNGDVDRCLVLAAEELDWLCAEGISVFPGAVAAAEGAGALWLARAADVAPSVRLGGVVGPVGYRGMRGGAAMAEREVREVLALAVGASSHGYTGRARDLGGASPTESGADAGGVTPLTPLVGEGWAAGAAWQCVAAARRAGRESAAKTWVLVSGTQEAAVGAWFDFEGAGQAMATRES